MSSSGTGSALKPFTPLKPNQTQTQNQTQNQITNTNTTNTTTTTTTNSTNTKELPRRPSLSILQPTQQPTSTDSLSPAEPTTTSSSLSRASSAKSTSSVQAVPIKVPIRSSPIKLSSSSSVQSQPSEFVPPFILSTTSSIRSQLDYNNRQPSGIVQSISECRPNTNDSHHIHPLSSFQNLSIQPQSHSSIHSSISSYPTQSPTNSDQPPSNSSTSTLPNGAQTPKRIQDLIVGDVLGEGSYSTVYHVIDKSTKQKQYALKVLDKRHIQKEKKVKYVAVERDCLNLLHYHPGCIRLFSTFQDEFSLC